MWSRMVWVELSVPLRSLGCTFGSYLGSFPWSWNLETLKNGLKTLVYFHPSPLFLRTRSIKTPNLKMSFVEGGAESPLRTVDNRLLKGPWNSREMPTAIHLVAFPPCSLIPSMAGCFALNCWVFILQAVGVLYSRPKANSKRRDKVGTAEFCHRSLKLLPVRVCYLATAALGVGKRWGLWVRGGGTGWVGFAKERLHVVVVIYLAPRLILAALPISRIDTISPLKVSE